MTMKKYQNNESIISDFININHEIDTENSNSIFSRFKKINQKKKLIKSAKQLLEQHTIVSKNLLEEFFNYAESEVNTIDTTSEFKNIEFIRLYNLSDCIELESIIKLSGKNKAIIRVDSNKETIEFKLDIKGTPNIFITYENNLVLFDRGNFHDNGLDTNQLNDIEKEMKNLNDILLNAIVEYIIRIIKG